jgi:hypothetical protein
MEASVGVGKPMQGTLLITHPVVQGKLTYLESGASFDGTLPLGGGAPRIPPVTEGEYPEQWSVAKLWWKSDLIIGNLLFLRSMRTKPDSNS